MIPPAGILVKQNRFEHLHCGRTSSMTETRTAIDDARTVQSSDVDGVRRLTSYAADKERILNRLRRMEGQLRGVQKMVEGDQYCVDVLTQLSAIISATRRVGLLVLENHIRGCVLDGQYEDREQIVGDLTDVIERFTRTAG